MWASMNQVGARHLHAHGAVVATEPDHVAVGDGHIDFEPFLGEDGQHAPAGQDKVGGLVPASDRHPTRVHDCQE